MTSALSEIQDLAKFYDQKLREKYTDVPFANGGTLFLGKHYADSDKIFLGLNPGTYGAARNRTKFGVVPSPENRLWGNHPSPYNFNYWRNSNFFFGSQPNLARWIEDATSTFLIPWATASANDLKKHPARTEIYKYSCDLLNKMIEHHRARTLITVGVETLRIISLPEFLNFPVKVCTVDYYPADNYGPRGMYQCRKLKYEALTIYQVPHFARANNKDALNHCALWLQKHISNSIGINKRTYN